MAAPERTRYIEPHTDGDSEAVLAEAVASLGRLRLPFEWPGNGAAEIHLLSSLIAEAESRLLPAVVLARSQGCSWAQIADLLGITRAAAWQRFAEQVRASQTEARKELLAND